jgi:hypothetical protein
MGRRAVGIDINSLAVFVSKAKTTLYTRPEISNVQNWATDFVRNLNISLPSQNASPPPIAEKPINISDRDAWRIRKALSLALINVSELPPRQERLARCILLKAAQWALDCHERIPNIEQFREQILACTDELASGARDYARAVRQADRAYGLSGRGQTLCLQRSAIGLESEKRLEAYPAPRLILTSPPYPGVHILYHRWQVQGRRETNAPFWITNTVDGNGASYYTFGDRHQKQLTVYYERMLDAFTSLAKIADKQTLLVQMIAFSDPLSQLDQYLLTMRQSGFREVKFQTLANSRDGRLWRCIPNRKWYANPERAHFTSQEVVLFHRLAT